MVFADKCELSDCMAIEAYKIKIFREESLRMVIFILTVFSGSSGLMISGHSMKQN